MSYRDSLDAAMARLAILEQELAEKTASSAATEQEVGRRNLRPERYDRGRMRAGFPLLVLAAAAAGSGVAPSP